MSTLSIKGYAITLATRPLRIEAALSVARGVRSIVRRVLGARVQGDFQSAPARMSLFAWLRRAFRKRAFLRKARKVLRVCPEGDPDRIVSVWPLAPLPVSCYS